MQILVEEITKMENRSQKEIIMLGYSLILWKSNKQKFVGLSTCIVELFACSNIVKDVKWLSNLLVEMKLETFLNKLVVVY